MKFLRKINLEINKDLYDPIKVKQNDTARYLLFNLLDDRVPFSLENKTVRVYGLKPDGTKVFNNLTIINAARGLAELQLTTQMLVKPGCLKLELVIYEATDILSTTKFDIDIISCLRDDESIESTNEFSALTLGLSKLDEWDKYFKETSGAIEEKYTERLNRIDASLEEKATKAELSDTKVEVSKKANSDFVNEELIKKANISEVRESTLIRQINVSEMDTETKKLFTGGAVAVVGENAIGNENLKVLSSSIDKTNFMKTGKNKFNKDRVTRGYAVNETNGVISANASFSVSDFCYIRGMANGRKNGTATFAYYDSNKVFISGGKGTEYLSDIPSNAVYCRFSIPNTVDLNTVMLVEGSMFGHYETYSEINIYPEKRKMLIDDIKMSRQLVTFNSDGSVSRIEHKDLITEEIIRTDSFEYATGYILEARLLYDGTKMTYRYDLNNLSVEVQ